MKDRDVQDRDLLDVLLKEHAERLSEDQAEAFTSIATQGWPLTNKQSEWVRAVAKKLGVLVPEAENLFSSMTPKEQAKHRSKVVTQLPWETGAMKKPTKPPGRDR